MKLSLKVFDDAGKTVLRINNAELESGYRHLMRWMRAEKIIDEVYPWMNH